MLSVRAHNTIFTTVLGLESLQVQAEVRRDELHARLSRIMERIWLDPFSSQYLSAVLKRAQGVDGHASARIDKIGRVLDAYHTIHKTELAKFPLRMSTLIKLGAALAKEASSANFGTFQPVLTELIRRCANKPEYLRLLIDYYMANDAEINNPQSLVDALNAARETSRTQNVVNGWLSIGTKNISLDKTNRMERLDPAHRNWGLKLVDNTLVPEGTDFLSLTASKWAAEVTAGTATLPLFLWLEGQADLMGYGEQVVANSVHAVPYYKANQTKTGEMFWIRKSSVGLEQAWLGEGLHAKWRMFDTSNVTGAVTSKGKHGHLAYVWNAKGELFAALHNPIKDGNEGVFHHSSFTGGGAVKCAGMIGAKSGLITYIDNDSGHYKPSREQLKAFVAQLVSWQVVDKNLNIHNASDRTDADVKTFLTSKGAFLGGHRL